MRRNSNRRAAGCIALQTANLHAQSAALGKFAELPANCLPSEGLINTCHYRWQLLCNLEVPAVLADVNEALTSSPGAQEVTLNLSCWRRGCRKKRQAFQSLIRLGITFIQIRVHMWCITPV